MVNQFVIALHVDDLNRSRTFYETLLDLQPTYESEWCVQLTAPGCPTLNLTLQPRSHELVPTDYRSASTDSRRLGVSLVFVIDDVDACYARAREMDLEIVQSPQDEFYGQRRFLCVDPDGFLVDVSSPCEPSAEFLASFSA